MRSPSPEAIFRARCLVAAIAAIGMKTQWREFVNVGLKPVVLMVGETIFLAALVLAMVRWAA